MKINTQRQNMLVAVILTAAIAQFSYLAFAQTCGFCIPQSYYREERSNCENYVEGVLACWFQQFNATGGSCSSYPGQGNGCIPTSAIVTESYTIFACDPTQNPPVCSGTVIAQGTLSVGTIPACYDESNPSCN